MFRRTSAKVFLALLVGGLLTYATIWLVLADDEGANIGLGALGLLALAVAVTGAVGLLVAYRERKQ